VAQVVEQTLPLLGQSCMQVHIKVSQLLYSKLKPPYNSGKRNNRILAVKLFSSVADPHPIYADADPDKSGAISRSRA